ncbi:hypothetical protein O1611_g6697 [Lasiodiplodia mahajangana]|uniref:Uncharacterized protein n=1 Tax=Lasiodiplodia mahajangana TaxID=1108764 RepID=A0ACC2JHN8_9PEZI|nr:hypothetical protein O1611_g6697 [Lasiodiplodia mahajangana]
MTDKLLMEKSLDPAIRAVLPSGGQVLSVKKHGESHLNRFTGYKVKIGLKSEKIEYYLKVLDGPNHFEMAHGEFESQKELGKYIPDNVTSPLAYGPLERDSSSSFFLAKFLRLNSGAANSQPLAEVLGRLHDSSASPTAKFGFHVTTYNGTVPLVNDWCDTWEEYFGRQLKSDIEYMHSIQGPDPEFDEVAERLFEKVIPRLLRPLESGGRSIKPVLVHGDVWPGNVKFDEATQHVVLYGSCCCYGHSELDLAMMKDPPYRFKKEHSKSYEALVPRSEPVKDYHDRNAIYAMRHDIINLCLYNKEVLDSKEQSPRDKILKEMKRLIKKYPNGIAGYEPK